MPNERRHLASKHTIVIRLLSQPELFVDVTRVGYLSVKFSTEIVDWLYRRTNKVEKRRMKSWILGHLSGEAVSQVQIFISFSFCSYSRIRDIKLSIFKTIYRKGDEEAFWTPLGSHQ